MNNISSIEDRKFHDAVINWLDDYHLAVCFQVGDKWYWYILFVDDCTDSNPHGVESKDQAMTQVAKTWINRRG